jgi:hypothetical protein
MKSMKSIDENLGEKDKERKQSMKKVADIFSEVLKNRNFSKIDESLHPDFAKSISLSKNYGDIAETEWIDFMGYKTDETVSGYDLDDMKINWFWFSNLLSKYDMALKECLTATESHTLNLEEAFKTLIISGGKISPNVRFDQAKKERDEEESDMSGMYPEG